MVPYPSQFAGKHDVIVFSVEYQKDLPFVPQFRPGRGLLAEVYHNGRMVFVQIMARRI